MQKEQQVQQESQQQGEAEEFGDVANLRLQLLYLAKEILQHKETMRWETHKQMSTLSIDDVIESAKKLYDFVASDD
tara:strand:- start:111 stop:338 length:228 start_codon:yes stop_codon:yes gene_type:complete